MKRIRGIVLSASLSLICSAPPRAEAIQLSLVPSSATASIGELVAVDAIVSGLGSGLPPSVGAFDLDVAFAPEVFEPVGITFGPFLGDPLLFEAFTSFDFGTPAIVDFAEVSLLAAADLDALQPSTFSLATLMFIAISDGQSTFRFVGERRIDDAFGNKLAIPEPPTVVLAGLGVLGLLWRRRAGITAEIA